MRHYKEGLSARVKDSCADHVKPLVLGSGVAFGGRHDFGER